MGFSEVRRESGNKSFYSTLVPCVSQGEFGRLLDTLHRNLRLDALHPITSGQVSDLKAAVIVQVFGHDPQEEIAVACHQVALDHLRHSPDHFGEALYGLFVLRSQPDAGEQDQADADLGGVQHGDVPFDDPGFFEEFDAASAGRGGKTDHLRQLHVLQAAVALKGHQDAAVGVVQLHAEASSEALPFSARHAADVAPSGPWATSDASAGHQRGFSMPYYLAVAAGLYLTWIVSTAVGAALGPAMGDVEAYGCDMAFVAVFLVLLRSMWKGVRAARP